jgi:hypothetical protein
VIFANCPFPTLDEDASETRPITIGEGFCRKPYKAKHCILSLANVKDKNNDNE